jgi:hypothetical protein
MALRVVGMGLDASKIRDLVANLITRLATTHTRVLLPAALASVLFGFVLVRVQIRVRVRVRVGHKIL